MKLVNQKGESRHYALNQNEVDLLKSLLKRFPFTANFPAKISRTDADPKSAERERVLNESLAEHRRELKKQAMNLVSANTFKQNEKGHSLTLNAEEREILLQILNDIRVGCWRASGEPETMGWQNPDCSTPELQRHRLMNLAGYFEHHLIG